MSNYMESTLRVGIILPDRYCHIPLPIITKHELVYFCCPVNVQ